MNIAATLWAVGIAFFSLLPAQAAVSTGTWDKLEHSLAYAVLTVSARQARPKSPQILVGTLCALYGGAIEAAQYLSPGRHPDFFDGVANALGVLVGLTLYQAWLKLRHKMQPE
jgi:VanZ family protein